MAVIKLSNGSFLCINFITETSFRLRMSENPVFRETNPYARYGIFDFAGNNPDISAPGSGNPVFISSDKISVAINKETVSMAIKDKNGKDTVKTGKPLWAGSNGGFSIDLSVSDDERFYGLGDVNREILQKRGTTAQIWVKNVKSYVPIPFLMSSGGWAVFSNTTYRHNFDICDTDPGILRIFGYYGEMDILFFKGDDFLSLLNQYTAVSGRPSLLPKFGYGLTFVCNQQADARELIDDCLRFRDRDIPCDVIGLEPGWMETYYNKTVNKKFDKERFYIPEWSSGPSENTFAAAVKRLGFKLSLWMCCDYDLSFEEERNAVIPLESDEHDEQMDYLPSKDDFEQDQNIGHEPLKMDQITVRDQGFFEHLKEFVDLGARAFKMDGAWQVNEHPDRKWGNGMDDVQMHNLYPLILNKQMSTGFTEHTGCRSMIYSSGGFAGIQQYAATWAGDTGGGPKPLVSMLNHAMSGHVNTSCDMHVFTKEGIHFGFLQSWSQVCSWAYWRHPWTLGNKLEDVFRYYAKLRYSLIPYIYSTAYQAYLTGMPIMRPLSFLYPGDMKADGHIMEYMLGDSLLVTCYTDDLYLPEGKWTDCFTGREYNGPFEGKYDIPEDKGGALFIKGGAIIPSQTPLNYIGEEPVNQLILDIYPDGDSSFTIYDDDGISMDYKDGKRSEILITCSENKDNVQVVISGRHGNFDGMVENLSLLVNIYAPKPAAVTLNMETCDYIYDDGCISIENLNANIGNAIVAFY